MNQIPTAATPGFARLPAALREQLNRRLEDGVQAKPLVEWLNQLPKVKTVLEEQSEGRLIRRGSSQTTTTKRHKAPTPKLQHPKKHQ